MGSGKTRAALTAWRELAWPPDRLLIVCPKVARGVWSDELDLQGIFPVQVVVGTIKAPDPDARVVIVNFDIVKSNFSWLARWVTDQTMIVDESHRVRNSTAQRTKFCRQLAVRCARIYLLSGTPLVNSALDIYQQLRLLGPRNPFSTYSEGTFANQFTRKRFQSFIGREGGWLHFGIRNEEDLWAKARGVAQRLLIDDCIDLPKHLRLPMWLARGAGIPKAVDPSDAGALLATARAEMAPQKAQLTIEYVEDAIIDRPIVIFGYHHVFLNAVARHFEAPVIDGSTSGPARDEIRHAFQAGKIPILVAQLQAAGEAIDLYASQHAVFGEIHWSAVDHRQAEARIRRSGQTRDALYHYILCRESPDELIWNTILAKGAAIDKSDAAAVSLREAYEQFAAA